MIQFDVSASSFDYTPKNAYISGEYLHRNISQFNANF